MSQHLEQTQQQQLRQRLNPRQVRFGRMLEMSEPEFEDEVRRVLDENPALEEAVPVEMDDKPKDDEGNDFNETADDLARADYRDPDDIPSYRLNISNHSADDAYYEPIAIDEAGSGIAQLSSQLADFQLSDIVRDAAEYIIGNIDENGYLTRSVGDIAYDMAVGEGIYVSDDAVREALDVVRSLDPPGICAYDLRDCLLLQLRRLTPSKAVADAIVILDKHFDRFSKKHFERIMSAANLTEEDFHAAMKIITSLNPKPGSLLETVGAADRMRHISPDFNVDVSAEGVATISLAGRNPEFAIEESFQIDESSDVEALAFIRARRDEANDFIDLARRRRDTLLSVMKAIVKLQPEFFRSFDTAQLRPMVLRDIRELTGLDLSVISRATATKYAMTPFGMVALKSLFSESLGEDGETSVHAVNDALRELIEKEDKRSPLTDDALCKLLKEQGFDVARRTVAKYRERMGFPVARLRRN